MRTGDIQFPIAVTRAARTWQCLGQYADQCSGSILHRSFNELGSPEPHFKVVSLFK